MTRIRKFLFFALPLLLLVPFFVFASDYLNGALVRAEGDVKVYLVNNNIKRWISSLEVFNANNFKWQDVKIVSKKEVSEIGEGEKIDLEKVSKEINPIPLNTVSPTPSSQPSKAKINDKLPSPEYLRADWLFSDSVSNYGKVGQSLIFKYSTKSSDKVENFRLYEKKPSDDYFSKIADFKEVPSTGCEDVDVSGEWMFTEAGQCGYWMIKRIVPGTNLGGSQNGRGDTAYFPASEFVAGNYVYYVAGVDKDGLETQASPQAKLAFLNTISIISPVNSKAISVAYPVIEWTITNSWPSGSSPDYFVTISDNLSLTSSVWTRQFKILSNETKKQIDYNGPGLDPTKKYRVNIYGHYRSSEYDPDYVSIPSSIPEFWIRQPGMISLVKKVLASFSSLLDF